MTDVLVVGAGPVGLLLAGDLAAAGAAVAVVDRLAEPMTESRASLLTDRTAALLADRELHGLLSESTPEPGTHFAGLPFPLPGRPHRKVPQHRTEAALSARAMAAGAEVHRAAGLTGLRQDADGVTATVAGIGDVTARYVVGCDGADSTTRRLAGIGQVTRPPTRELLRADVTGIDIPPRRFERTPRGLAVAATRDGVTRVMVHEFGRPPADRPGPPAYAELCAAWAAVTGEDIAAAVPVWVDAFDNATGLAQRYRSGRVLLAGDAAHHHLPVGGHAINVGLADAADLAPRLVTALADDAPPSVLDAYTEARRPVAARVLELVSAQELLLLGPPPVEPLRQVLAELVALPRVRAHLAAASG